MLLSVAATVTLPCHMHFLYRSWPFAHLLLRSVLRMNVWELQDTSLGVYCVLFPVAHERPQQPQLIKDREKMCYRTKRQCNKYNSWERKDIVERREPCGMPEVRLHGQKGDSCLSGPCQRLCRGEERAEEPHCV